MTKLCRGARCLGFLLVAFLRPSPAALADGSTTLSGTVTNMQGAPVAGARLTLSGRGVRTAHGTSEADGAYRFPALSGATPYVLAVEHDDYRAIAYDGLLLESGRPLRFDIRLRRPDEREVVFIASRDPFPWDEMVAGLTEQIDLPVRVVDLDAAEDAPVAVRQVGAEHPNLIITGGLKAALEVRREVKDTPAILTLIGDPRLHDLESVNLCFVTNQPPPEELARRLSEIVPEARRIGIVYDARESAFVARDIHRALRRQRMKVEMSPCYRAGEIEAALDRLTDRVDALVVPYDPLMVSPGIPDRIIAWALRHRVPLAAPAADWVKRGALFSHGATPATISFDVAWVASQILFHGGQPADFGLRNPASRVMAVNRETAFALGIEIPPDLEFDLAY
jgi:putative ABC transport system substrate-binding protein